MFSLQSIAAMNMSYGQVMKLPDPELAVFSRALIDPVSRMDEYEHNESKRGLWEEFINNSRHICRVKSYRVRGLTKEVQGRAACWCYCPQGTICNCQCGSILTILMEFRENQIWRSKGPNIPRIKRDMPIKNYIYEGLVDPDPFYNASKFVINRFDYPELRFNYPL